MQPELHLNPEGQSIQQTVQEYRRIFFSKIVVSDNAGMDKWKNAVVDDPRLINQIALVIRQLRYAPKVSGQNRSRGPYEVHNAFHDFFLRNLQIPVNLEAMRSIPHRKIMERYILLHELTESWVATVARMDSRFASLQFESESHLVALQTEFATAATRNELTELLEARNAMDVILKGSKSFEDQYKFLMEWAESTQGKDYLSWEMLPDTITDEELRILPE